VRLREPVHVAKAAEGAGPRGGKDVRRRGFHFVGERLAYERLRFGAAIVTFRHGLGTARAHGVTGDCSRLLS
jgi:hypothetical protein